MKTILLAEDESSLRETLADALASVPGAGYQVFGAGSGLHAIEELGRRAFDLVITDLSMPVVDGIALLAHLNAHLPRLPVIVISGYGFPEAHQFVRNLGARLFFEKPFEMQMLQEGVERLLTDECGESWLHGFSLYSFLQMMEMEKKTSQVHVQTGDRAGQLSFQKGQLLSAAAEGKQGELAVYEMLHWRNPHLRVASYFQMPPPNVNAPLSTLLMESARSFDEKMAAANAVLTAGASR